MKIPLYRIVLLGLLAHPTLALAEDQAVISTARELAKQAFEAYDEGRYEEAAEKSLKAYQVVHVPTLAVNRARALVKLGQLVAASELYLEAARLPRDPSWQAVQDEAMSNAESERAALMPRIPRVRIETTGVDPSQVVVSIDRRNIPNALLDTDHVVDPGSREVLGSYGKQRVRLMVELKESERQQVTLRFAAETPVGATVEPTEASPTVVTQQEKPTNVLKILGWSSAGVGFAGLLIGAAEGYSAKSKRASLIDTGLCSSDGEHCDFSLSSEVDSYKRARTLSMVGLYSGGALAAVGITLLVLPTKKEPRRTVGLLLGPRFIGVRGDLL